MSDKDRLLRLESRVRALEALGDDFIEFRSGDATPSVGGATRFKTTNAAATTITALDEGKNGQTVIVFIDDPNTTIDFTGTTLKGNGGVDWSPGDGDFMVCTKGDDDNWRCQVTEV